MQALATACVACGPTQPAETKHATTRLVEQLVLLVNPENELDHIGTTGPVRPSPALLHGPSPALPQDLQSMLSCTTHLEYSFEVRKLSSNDDLVITASPALPLLWIALPCSALPGACLNCPTLHCPALHCLSLLSMSCCCHVTDSCVSGVQIDEGCVRLATANALLKLAKSQDNPVSADVYMQLALTMQVGNPLLFPNHFTGLAPLTTPPALLPRLFPPTVITLYAGILTWHSTATHLTSTGCHLVCHPERKYQARYGHV